MPADRSHFIRNLWRWKCGLPESPPVGFDLEELRRTQWWPDFEAHQRRRLIMGAVRYGPMLSEFKPQFDRLAEARRRIDAYAADGNLEHLVDVANLMGLEFVEGRHPLAHFEAVDDGVHASTKGVGPALDDASPDNLNPKEPQPDTNTPQS